MATRNGCGVASERELRKFVHRTEMAPIDFFFWSRKPEMVPVCVLGEKAGITSAEADTPKFRSSEAEAATGGWRSLLFTRVDAHLAGTLRALSRAAPSECAQSRSGAGGTKATERFVVRDRLGGGRCARADSKHPTLRTLPSASRCLGALPRIASVRSGLHEDGDRVDHLKSRHSCEAAMARGATGNPRLVRVVPVARKPIRPTAAKRYRAIQVEVSVPSRRSDLGETPSSSLRGEAAP